MLDVSDHATSFPDKSLAKKALKGEPIEKSAEDEETTFSEDTAWLDNLGD